MKPKIWTGEKTEAGGKTEAKELPMPMIIINDAMCVILVDEEVDYLASLTGSTGYCSGVERTLEYAGYDTSWAEWDKDGRFAGLT